MLTPRLLLIGGLVASSLSAQAIYTTDKNGIQVNGNSYKFARDVYLRGGTGPNSPCSGQGLDNGHYYFQVTDTSGQVLLSTDPITSREVIVTNGVISGTVGNAHATRNAPCSSKVVQLIPFLVSPSSDVYKVWLTPVAEYDPTANNFFGFFASSSKTDNFKVTGGGPPASNCLITGYKWFDHTQDGIWDPIGDPLEVPIAGWRIEISSGGTIQDVTFTDVDGRYSFIRPIGSTVYTIEEHAPGGFVGDGIRGAVWIAVTPRTGTVVPTAVAVAGPSFGNVSLEVKPGVGRTKGFWHNNNGQVLLADCPEWREVLWLRNNLPVGLRTNVSSADPQVSLLIPPFPSPAVPPPPFFALDFLSAHSYFANWIVGNPALGHAGFILSTQVAASILNGACGFMQFDAYIDRFQNGVLVSFDDMVAGATGLLSDPGAGLTGPNDPEQELREMMLMCTNEFDSINNTGDLGEPQVVYGKTESPILFESPYAKTTGP